MAINGKAELLALMVASGSSIKDAAASLGIGERTAYRFAADQEFSRRVSQIRTEAVVAAVGQLATLATRAAEALGEVLREGDSGAKIRAAAVVLDRFSKLSEAVDLRGRIERLEKLTGADSEKAD